MVQARCIQRGREGTHEYIYVMFVCKFELLLAKIEPYTFLQIYAS